jgi:cytochrome P450
MFWLAMIERVRTSGTPLSAAWINNPCGVLYEIAKQKPEQDLLIELGGGEFFLLQNSKSIANVLRDQQKSFRKYMGNYIKLFGKSRLTSDDPEWRPLRDLSQPFITKPKPNVIMSTAQGFFTAAADDILKAGRSSVINVEDALDRAAAATVCKVVLGFPIEEWGPHVIEDIRKVLRLASWENFPEIGTGGLQHAFLEAEATEALERLRVCFEDALGTARNADAGLLASTLSKIDDRNVDLFGEMATLLFAGFDTTSSAISWSLFLLAANPQLQDRIYQEVAGLSEKPEIMPEDIEELTVLQGFFLETMRIFPPIPVLSRIALEQVDMGQYAIPEGARILMSVIGLQQSPHAFPAPLEVRPERHPNGRISPTALGAFLPFGDGRRICPGAKFASIEALTALVVLIGKAEFRLASRGKLSLSWDASMRRDGGMKLRAVARKKTPE